MKKVLFLVSIVVIGLMSSCKPYQKPVYETVEPNETAYVIPLETGNKAGQAKLKSEAYLEQNKVATQRIYIPTQWLQEGRSGNDGKWIPSVRVIKVNRTPVTREWNGAGGGSNNSKNEALEVESKESIGFSVCITATASVPEESTSLFLYSYSGKTLSEVMDLDVRGYIQNILTTEFGNRTLTMCQNERNAVFESMRKNVIAHFAQYGIKIMNVGSAGQFVYTNPDIQTSINEKYSSEMNIVTAQNKVTAANKFAQAKAAIEAQSHLDADIQIKLAIAQAIKEGKLNIPSNLTVAGGNFSILEMYGLKNMNNAGKTK